jgi:hypothetical protein
MASVDIPFNFNNRKFGEKDQREKQLINFYAYQDPNSQKNPEQQIKICQENQDLCFKKVLVCIILCLSAITLFKSCFLISCKLSKNLALNFQLQGHEKQLKKAKNKLKTKIKAHSSSTGLKKLIKQEFKAIEANEILVRFE